MLDDLERLATAAHLIGSGDTADRWARAHQACLQAGERPVPRAVRSGSRTGRSSRVSSPGATAGSAVRTSSSAKSASTAPSAATCWFRPPSPAARTIPRPRARHAEACMRFAARRTRRTSRRGLIGAWPALLHWRKVAPAGEGSSMRPRRSRPVPLVPSSAFTGFRFPREIVIVAVRWYLRYGLAYRDRGPRRTGHPGTADFSSHLGSPDVRRRVRHVLLLP